MKIVNPQERFGEKVTLTIGMFDGVHRGHQELIRCNVENAFKIDALPAVYTFVNHPVKEKKRYFINALEEKLYLFKKLGIKVVFLNELTNEFMRTNPLKFVEKELVERINTVGIVIGEDFRFGFNRKGDINFLRKVLEPRNIIVQSIPLYLVNGEPVKSSAIAKLIKDGLISEANEFLGYKFFLSGSVISGKGLGRHLGFPTANLKYINGNKVLPKNGVYITIGEVNGKYYSSVSNVGCNPTFESDNKIKVEVHFLNTDVNLYGEFMRLYFLKRIRDEKKFESAESLKKEVSNDIKAAREFFLQFQQKML